jgi:hypothetical protein
MQVSAKERGASTIALGVFLGLGGCVSTSGSPANESSPQSNISVATPTVVPSPALVQLEGALRTFQPVLLTSLISESLEPGLLGNLAKTQRDFLLHKVRQTENQFEQSIEVGITSNTINTAQALRLGRFASQFSEFVGALREDTGVKPGATFSLPFKEGKVLYEDLRTLAREFAFSSLKDLPGLDAILMTRSNEPYKGSIRLDTAWGLPPSHLEKLERDQKVEHQQLIAKRNAEEAEHRKEQEHHEAAKKQAARAIMLSLRDVKSCAPAFIKLDDANLLMFHAKDGHLHALKTSTGYAESGFEGHIGFKGVSLGGGIDSSEAHLYGEVSYLEALAYLKDDLAALETIVRKQEDRFPQTLHAEFILSVLSPLVGSVTDDAIKKATTEPRLVTYGPTVQRYPPTQSIPVFVPLPDLTMLRVTQFSDTIKFEKTASGYGVEGGKFTFLVVGGGREVPTHHQYAEISAQEALAYFNGDISPIYNKVCRQAINVGDCSVWPSVAWKALCPTEPAIRLKREQHSNKTAPAVAPPQESISALELMTMSPIELIAFSIGKTNPDSAIWAAVQAGLKVSSMNPLGWSASAVLPGANTLMVESLLLFAK